MQMLSHYGRDYFFPQYTDFIQQNMNCLSQYTTLMCLNVPLLLHRFYSNHQDGAIIAGPILALIIIVSLVYTVIILSILLSLNQSIIVCMSLLLCLFHRDIIMVLLLLCHRYRTTFAAPLIVWQYCCAIISVPLLSRHFCYSVNIVSLRS